MEKVKDLFVETKKVVEEYKKQAEVIHQQEQELKLELAVMQSEMDAIFLDMEATDSLSDKIYLHSKVKEIVSKAEIVETMLEDLEGEKTALKLKFSPLYQQALRKDSAVKNSYSATQIVEKYKYLMLQEIAEIGEQMQSQYREISEDVYEVFEDSEVKKQYPRLEYYFHKDQYTPAFGWYGDAVVSKNEVFNAGRGNKPNKPKHMEGEK
jgi:hypothetical protein